MTTDTKTDLRDEAVKIEAAICRRLRYLAGRYAMQLDWEVTFFAGNLGPPKPGENWTFTFSSSGKKQTVTLTEQQLVEFRHGHPEGVDEEIHPALRRLKDDENLTALRRAEVNFRCPYVNVSREPHNPVPGQMFRSRFIESTTSDGRSRGPAIR